MSTGVTVGVKACCVAMEGTVVEVGKMFGLSDTMNGSNRGAFGSCTEGVGVSATPQMEVEFEVQAVMSRISTRRMTARGRRIGFMNYIRIDKCWMS
jgi:hypothetical protein